MRDAQSKDDAEDTAGEAGAQEAQGEAGAEDTRSAYVAESPGVKSTEGLENVNKVNKVRNEKSAENTESEEIEADAEKTEIEEGAESAGSTASAKGKAVAYPGTACVGALALVLTACSGDDRLDDIRVFMAEVERSPLEGVAPLPEFAPHRPFIYSGATGRSPFEPPGERSSGGGEQAGNTGAGRPQKHVRRYLEGFPLSALAMVGTMRKGKAVFALIEDADGGVHLIQVGDYLGDRWGRVERIEDARLHVTETVSDGAGGWQTRPGALELGGYRRGDAGNRGEP